MTNQQIFDTVVRHLYTQRKQASNSAGECLYRGPDGTKCAVGCLIPDDKYDPRMDDRRNVNMSMEDAIKIAGIPSAHERLLSNLQNAHDNTNNWGIFGPTGSMVDLLRVIATRFKLKTNVLQEVSA